MTLYILESGITKASEVTTKFFKRTKMFFVRKNHNGTISFISATFPDDVLTTSSIKSFSQAENGYMRIVTQNSVINVTPFVIGCFKLHPYQVEEMMGYCPFIKTETMPYKSVWNNGVVVAEAKEDAFLIVKTKEKFSLISEHITSQPYDDENWVDGTDRVFKDENGYLYFEHNYVLSDGTRDNAFVKTNIQIG